MSKAGLLLAFFVGLNLIGFTHLSEACVTKGISMQLYFFAAQQILT